MTYANRIGWTDITPFEVVRTVSEKCLEVREMSAEMDPTWKPETHVGGFVAHVSNNHAQRWIIASNPAARTVRIRLHKDGYWREAKGGERFKLAAEPQRFYDFNF